MKYVVSFGWEICDEIMYTDFSHTFSNKDEAELFQKLIWENNTKEYDMALIEEVKA